MLSVLLCCAGCQEAAFELARSPSAGAHAEAEPIPAQGVADEVLQQRLTRIYAQVKGLEHVRAEVSAGVVHLSGKTENVALGHQAVAFARRLEGVVYVDSRLDKVSPDRWLSTITGTLGHIGTAALALLPRLAAALLVLLPFVLLSWALGRWKRPLRLFGVRKLTGSLVKFVMRGLVLFSGLLITFDILGIVGAISALVGALGILGLASGILFKDWIASYLPAFLVGIHPPFKAGDLVAIGSFEGRVIRITPRGTVLMTMDGEIIRLPNALLLKEPMINYSQQRERRLRFVIPLSPRADLGMAQEIGCRALLALHGIKEEPPPFMRTQELQRDAVHVEFFAWVDQDIANYRNVSSRARRAVFEALGEAGVPLPTDARELTFKTSRAGALESAAAEASDDAFLSTELERVRKSSSTGERDLLDNAALTA